MKRVLIIEDNKEIAEVFAQLVELTGCQSAVAHDAEKGLSLARSWKPQAILCDLNLPGSMGGLDFARACKADAELKSITMMAVSGLSGPEDRLAAQQAGFDDLVGKPIGFDIIEKICVSDI